MDGDVEVDGVVLAMCTPALLQPGQSTKIRATATGTATRLLVMGGDALDGSRFISCNFVSSRKERIHQAKADWQAQRMGQVPGDAEFIPLHQKESRLA